MASRWLRFIFQLPAISGVRVLCSVMSVGSPCSWSGFLARQRGQAGQRLAFEVLQARAAACGNMAESGLVESQDADGCGRVAAADHGERGAVHEGLRDGAGAVGEV